MFRRLLIAALLAVLPVAAQADNMTKVSWGCGPLDGRTLEMQVFAPDVSYKLTIWSRGYADLEKGVRDFRLGDDINIGQSSICAEAAPGAPCHSQALTVKFTTLELREGGAAVGNILFGSMAVPFSGALHGMKQCG